MVKGWRSRNLICKSTSQPNSGEYTKYKEGEGKGRELERVGGALMNYPRTGSWFGPRNDAILLFSHRMGFFRCCHGNHQLSGHWFVCSVQFSSVARSCPTLCDPMDCSTPVLPVHHQLPEFIQTHVHWVGDAIKPSYPLLSPSPPAFNLFQHQNLFKWVSSSHQAAKVLEFQLQHQSFQWIFRIDL